MNRSTKLFAWLPPLVLIAILAAIRLGHPNFAGGTSDVGPSAQCGLCRAGVHRHLGAGGARLRRARGCGPPVADLRRHLLGIHRPGGDRPRSRRPERGGDRAQHIGVDRGGLPSGGRLCPPASAAPVARRARTPGCGRRRHRGRRRGGLRRGLRPPHAGVLRPGQWGHTRCARGPDLRHSHVRLFRSAADQGPQGDGNVVHVLVQPRPAAHCDRPGGGHAANLPAQPHGVGWATRPGHRGCVHAHCHLRRGTQCPRAGHSARHRPARRREAVRRSDRNGGRRYRRARIRHRAHAGPLHPCQSGCLRAARLLGAGDVPAHPRGHHRAGRCRSNWHRTPRSWRAKADCCTRRR